MDRYAIVIRSDGKTIKLHCFPGDTVPLKDLQEMVEGHIEVTPTMLAASWSREKDTDAIILIINEEGKLKGLPLNQKATDISGINLYDDVIVGNAILMAVRGEELIGLTEEAADNIIKQWKL